MSNTRSIAVRFDETSWNYWGIPWTASLNFLAKFPGQIVVVDFGIPGKAQEFFARLNNYVAIPAEKKYGVQELDFVHTISNYASKNKGGVYAAWDNTCYFQSDVNEIFNLASDKLVCCCSTGPQLNLRSSISAFGYSESVVKDQEKFYKILKKIARKYTKPIGSGLLAGPADLWTVYDNFINICLDTGFLLPEEQANQAALNLFVWAYESLTSVVDSSWCQPITEELKWDNGFSRNGDQIKVVHITSDMQYSAESASYHFRNRFSKLHDEWSAQYRGCSFNPKRVMKPSLGKLKKVT